MPANYFKMQFAKNVIQILSSRPDYWPWVGWMPFFLALWVINRLDRGEALRNRFRWLAPAIGLLMLAVFGWFNWVFLRSPLYLGPISHLQPQIADVSWYFATCRPVYHGADSGEVYNLLYGPWLYIITGGFEKVFGAGIFSAKLGGELAVGASLVWLILLLRRKAGIGFALLVSGLFAALLMALDPVESLVRADVFIVLGVVAGCWAAQSPLKFAPVAFGVLTGICFNLKIHSPIYFLPLLWVAWQSGHRGKALAVAALSAAVTAILPFVIFPNVSWQNYWWTLRVAGAHGFDPNRFLDSLEWFFLLCLPIAAVAALAYVKNPGETAKALGKLKPFIGLIFISFIILLPFASKFGAGPHHLLPLIPTMLLLAAEFVTLNGHWLGGRSFPVLGLQAALFSWLAASFTVGLVRSYQDTAWLKDRAPWAQSVNADIDQILAKYSSNSVILMGTGGEEDYMATFFRTKLVFAGMPDGIEAGPLMEFAFAGKSQADLGKLVAMLNHDYGGKKILWLVPKGNAPFSMSTMYALVMRGDYQPHPPLFDENFREAFAKNFSRIGVTQFYDLYSN